jgi:tetratricopeptide (TPR) repeat protein
MILAESLGATADIAPTRQYLNQLPATANQAVLQVALGILSFREKNYPAAATAFQSAQTIDPHCAVAYSAMGAWYQQQTNFSGAETAYKTAADLAPLRSNFRLNYANFEIQTGHPEVADAFLEETLKSTPDFVAAWVLRAEIAIAAKKYDDCQNDLTTALSRDPDNYDAALLSGQLAMAQGDVAKAKTQLDRLTHKYDRIPRLHYLLALTSLANNDMNAAIISLERALRLQTNFTDASLLLAEVRIKSGQPDPAVAILQEVIDRQPDLAQAKLLMADAFRALGQPDKALAIYAQLALVQPKNPGIPLLEGFTYQEQQDRVSARQAFTKALVLAPSDLRTLDAMVQLDLADKQFDPAIDLLEKALLNSPQKYEINLREAKVYEAQGKAAQTVAVLEKAINSNPGLPAAHLVLAEHYYKQKAASKALAELETVLQITPGNLTAWMLKAEILDAAKDYVGAESAYNKMLEIDPQSIVALNNLACLYSENLGQVDKAYELAKKARDLQPLDPSTADTLGWVLFNKGDYASALELLKESAGKLPGAADVQFHFGKANYMMGQEAPAAAAFHLALQIDPTFAEHEECQQCLDLLAIDPAAPGIAARQTLAARIVRVPDDPVALSRLLVIYQNSGDTSKAIQVGEAILNANPNNTTALLALARLYLTQNLSKALDLAKRAHDASPQDPDVSYLLGQITYQTGQYKWALSLLQDTARAQPNNPNVQFDLARAAYGIGHVDDARAAFQKALGLGLDPVRAPQARQWVELLTAIESPAQARSAAPICQSILKSDPVNVPALMVVAMVAENNAKLDDAGQYYERVLKICPDFVPAQKKLALVYAQNPARIQDAYALAVKARQSLPDDPELTRLLGIILCQQGNYSQALDYLTLSQPNWPSDPILYYYLGIAQVRLQDSAAGRLSLRHALDLNLSGPLAVDARRILAGKP